MTYQLVKINPDEIHDVHEILKICGQDMKLHLGIGHWYPPYPRYLMKKDASDRSVYSVKNGQQLLATFTIGIQPLEYYNEKLWKHPEQKAVYVSHLAVLPEFQGKGIGSWCMKSIENIAITWCCGAVRLDAYEKYSKLIEFYDKLDYQHREVIKYYGLALVCFEKVIKND